MSPAEECAQLVVSVPWNRGTWNGKFLSFDNTKTDDFEAEDVKEIIATEGLGGWDGSCAAIVVLNDGRYVSWESDWGPTGSGFSEDAYGGYADINFSSTLLDAYRFGIKTDTRNELIFKNKELETLLKKEMEKIC